MSPKIEALLKITTMSEEECYNWLWTHYDTFGFDLKWIDFDVPSAKKDIAMHLADLAFRMRDDLHYVIGNAAWDRACWEVWKHEMKQSDSNIFERKSLSLDRREMFCWNWVATWASPIHWIIAALVTKEIETNPVIGQDDGKGGCGMWDGPNPSLYVGW